MKKEDTIPTTEKKVELIPFVLPSHMAGYGGWGNGYVAIPKGHPCFEMDYDTIHDKYDISVHGGLTFANDAIIGQPKETKGMWIIGFDTLHYGDESRGITKEWVETEAKELANQLELITENKELPTPVSDGLKEAKHNACLVALEFGYVQCEKGNNLQMAFMNYNKIINQK